MDDYSVLHPAVLRAIRKISEAATAASKKISVCGEAAADPATACLLVGLGIKSLSMSAACAARVRAALRSVSYEKLTNLANEVLALESPAEIAERVAGMLVAA